MRRSVLDQLADATLVALRVDGESWPRSLLSATLIPDHWVALVERLDGGRRLVPSGEDPRPARGDHLTLVRNAPITVPLHVAQMRAACGHAVTGTCELLLRWQPRDDDLAALGRTLLERGRLALDGLARAVADGGGQTALQQFIRQRPAERLVREDLGDELLAELRPHLQRFLFSTGLTLERVATLRLSSPSLAQAEALQAETATRVERLKAQELIQQAALAATQRRLEGLSSIFEQLNAAAAGNQHMQWHDLLPSLSPADRGRLLENLWRITPDQNVAAAIIIVTDQECLWLDPAAAERIIRRTTLGADLGGLRSVSYCPRRNWLLIGAARGVWTIAADSGEVCGRFEVPDAGQPRTGFNAAAATGDYLYATHSQLGCWTWPLERPKDGRALLQPASGVPKTIRAVTALADGRVALAADNRVRLFETDGREADFPGELTSAINCLTALDDWLYAGVEDGALFGFDRGGADVWVRVHRTAAPFESVQARRWADLIELVIPGGREGILSIFPQEGVVARLLEAPGPIRRAWACDDLVVGLSERRDKLVVLNANWPQRCGRELPLGRTLGRTVQDACIVTTGPNPDGGSGGSSHVA